MKIVIIIPLLSLQILSTGCGGGGVQDKQHANAEMDTVQQKHEKENSSEESEIAEKLVLNNGAKWSANSETKEGIQKMQSLVNEYLDKGDTDNKKLSESLEKEFTIILQECTMTGLAHEQLHNFLLPFKERIEKLKETKDIESVREIQAYLNNYYNYFE